MSDKEHATFITTTHGMRGWFAVMMHWNTDCGGFWEPLNTGFGSYVFKDHAEREGREWAEAEEMEFR